MTDKPILLHVGKTGFDSWIEVDGERIGGIKLVEVRVAADEFSQVHVTFIPQDWTVEIERDVWEKAIQESATAVSTETGR